MSKKETFISEIQNGYNFSGTSIVLGGAMLDMSFMVVFVVIMVLQNVVAGLAR